MHIKNPLSIRRKVRPDRSGNCRETDRYQEIGRHLEVLAKNQADIARAVKELGAEQWRTQPNKRTWLRAAIISLISIAIISVAISDIVHISLINGQADSLHRQAQATRSQAIDMIVETLAPFDQAIALGSRSQRNASQLPLVADNSMIAVIGSAHSLLAQADKTDASADSISTNTAFNLYLAEVVLVIGSAIAGGVISWVLTQFLINRRQNLAHAVGRSKSS